jgi:hypothetical protein
MGDPNGAQQWIEKNAGKLRAKRLKRKRGGIRFEIRIFDRRSCFLGFRAFPGASFGGDLSVEGIQPVAL